MPHIVADHREARSLVYRALVQRAQKGEITLETKELSSGDYLPHPSFAIERKEANDFVLSILDRRIFNQVLRLKDEYERVVFLIEGDPLQTRSAIPSDAVQGALSYLIAIENVSILSVNSAAETANLLVTLARHMQEGLGYVPPLRGDKPKIASDLARYLIEGLPGIGPAAAVALLDRFGCPSRVFTATVEELCSTPGIGKKTAERIRGALDWNR